uniref:DUF7597 domain-containing protein n=1 Tax=Oryza glumipatula TaxID=40148 RepID=A0A0D9ZHY0_9ORYZ
MADLPEELHYPQYFLPPGLQIEEHLCRASRADVTVQNPPTKRHEDFLAPPEGNIQDLIHQVVHIINHQYHFQVVRTMRFLLTFCLVLLTSEVRRDALLAGDPMVLNNGDFNARFKEGWIIILGVPPDFRNESHIERVVNTFGKLVCWDHRDRVLGRVLARCLYTDPSAIPRKIDENNALEVQIEQIQHHQQADVHEEMQHDSTSISDFSMHDTASVNNMGHQIQLIQNNLQIITYQALVPCFPFKSLPSEVCTSMAENVFLPLIISWNSPLLKQPIEYHWWLGFKPCLHVQIPRRV